MAAPAQVLAPGTAIADSGDIVVANGATLHIGLYLADDDNLLLPNVDPYYGGDLLLPDGLSILLLPTQATGGLISSDDEVTLKRKDPLGAYNPTGIVLNGAYTNHFLLSGTWQVSREAITSAKIGVLSD